MKELSVEEVQALLNKPKRTGVRAHPDEQGSKSLPKRGVPQCNHDWVPHTLIVTGLTRQEFPTKKCVLCDVWMLCQPGEMVEEIKDIAEWMS